MQNICVWLNAGLISHAIESAIRNAEARTIGQNDNCAAMIWLWKHEEKEIILIIHIVGDN